MPHGTVHVVPPCLCLYPYLYLYLLRRPGDRWGTIDDLAMSSSIFLSSASLIASLSLRPVHSGMLSSHLFLVSLHLALYPVALSWQTLVVVRPACTISISSLHYSKSFFVAPDSLSDFLLTSSFVMCVLLFRNSQRLN